MKKSFTATGLEAIIQQQSYVFQAMSIEFKIDIFREVP